MDASLSTGTGLRSRIAFGDGTAVEGIVARHVYGAAGVYTVTVVVTDERDRTSTASRELVVRSPLGTWVHSGYLAKARYVDVRRLTLTAQDGAGVSGVLTRLGRHDAVATGMLTEERVIRLSVADPSETLEGVLPSVLTGPEVVLSLTASGGAANGETLQFARRLDEPSGPPPDAVLKMRFFCFGAPFAVKDDAWAARCRTFQYEERVRSGAMHGWRLVQLGNHRPFTPQRGPWAAEERIRTMKRRRLLPICLIYLLALAAAATPVSAQSSFTATLDQSQEVPASGSAAWGRATLTLNATEDTLTYSITLVGLDLDGAQTPGNATDNVTGMHFHTGARGVNGPVAFGLISPAHDSDDLVINAAAGTVTGAWEATDTNPLSGQLANLKNEVLYLNVHTTGSPGGAIRGQVMAATYGLAVDFGTGVGLWTVRAGGIWNQVHNLSPEALATGDLDGNGIDDLVIDFGAGIGTYIWMNHATWVLLHPSSPSLMVVGDLDNDGHDEVFLAFPGLGLSRWNDGTWSQLHNLDPSHLATGDLDSGNGDELLVVFPGFGLFAYDDATGWMPLHPFGIVRLLTADLDGSGQDDVVVEFAGGLGLWAFMNQTTWMLIHPFGTTRVAAGQLDNNAAADLAIDFGPGIGIYTWRNGTTWAPLHPSSSEGLLLTDVDGNGVAEVAIDFGAGVGLWAYTNDATWELVHAFSPEILAAGRFH